MLDGVPVILWHVSFEPVEAFVPRVPKNRAPKENKTTPRICLSENINYAISAMPDGGMALRGMMKAKPKITPTLHLYSCLTWENPAVMFIAPDDVQEKYGVPDAKNSLEWWALQPPDMTHEIAEILNADFKDGIDPAGDIGVIVSNIRYRTRERLPCNAPEIVFEHIDCDLRQALAYCDKMLTIRKKLGERKTESEVSRNG